MGDPWEYYSFDDLHCGSGLHSDTLIGNCDAIAEATLIALWAVMLPIFKRSLARERKHGLIKAYFFLAFVYIRFYQPRETFARWLHFGRDKRSIGYNAFYDNVVPIIHLCAANLNEINWADRLAFNNHHELAPNDITFITDGFPQLVWQPVDPLMRSLLYVPDKYAAVIYKLHITIDLLGNVVHFTGLHLGTTPDPMIWRRTHAEHPTEENEFGYGDLAYEGEDDIITNFAPITQNGPLTALEDAYNKRMNQVRARVEHAVAEHVEGKQMFQGTYRGAPALLESCHMLYAHANRRARKFTGTKYEPYRPKYGPHNIY